MHFLRNIITRGTAKLSIRVPRATELSLVFGKGVGAGEHFVTKAVELCHNDRGFDFLCRLQRGGELRSPVERIGTLPAVLGNFVGANWKRSTDPQAA